MKTHVLLVDDDVDELQLFTEALKRTGLKNYKVTYADSVAQAEEILNYLKPHFIFVDFNMPERNGLDLLAIIQSIKELRFANKYLVSSSLTDEMRIKAIALGVNKCYAKSESLDSYVEVLKEIFTWENNKFTSGKHIWLL